MLFKCHIGVGGVKLKANQTLKGDICPAGIEFNCIAVKSVEWYLGNELLASYTPRSTEKQSIDLCDNTEDNDILHDFCKNGGGLWIQKVSRFIKYFIRTSLVTTGTYISQNQYMSIGCGNGNVSTNSKSLSTNFTMSCSPTTLNLTNNNTNVDGGVCEGVVEFECQGNDVDYFQWIYNDFTLSENFTYSVNNRYPYDLKSVLQHTNCSVTFADTINCFAERFNFQSTCINYLSDLEAAHMSVIGCVSSDRHKLNNISCELHWNNVLEILGA